MTKKIMLLIFTAFLLPACSAATQSPPTPTHDAVATEVSQLLTSMPTATVPLPTVTYTPPPPPTDTAEVPTATPTPEQTTPTPDVPDTTTTREPDWRESLDSGNAFFRFENENSRVTQENGHLVLTGITSNGWHGWSLTFSQQPRNFYLEAVMIPQTCSGSDLYGLVFRAPNANSGYFFGVTCDGRYNLHRRDFEDGTDVILIELTSSPAILSESNQTNRLGVRTEGDRIGVYANGTLLQEVTDSTYLEGYFGAFVAASETAGFTVWMDEIMLWKNP